MTFADGSRIVATPTHSFENCCKTTTGGASFHITCESLPWVYLSDTEIISSSFRATMWRFAYAG
jgi:hypothetical protein